jgi:hypothetical protein
MAAGLSPSLLNTSRRMPLARWVMRPLNGRATNDSTAVSCSGQPSRAAAREQEDGAGRVSICSAGTSRARLAPTP